MIFPDSDILSRLAGGSLVVSPISDVGIQVQPTNVDLRLGAEFLEFRHTNVSCIHPNRKSEVSGYVHETHVPEGDDFVLHSGGFALGATKERVEVPTDLLTTVEGRSSLGHLAVVIHATAGIVDPGYGDQITLELSNLGTAPVALTPGMYISQPVFTEMKSPADHPYGVKHGPKYQDQRGSQTSRLSFDPKFGGDE